MSTITLPEVDVVPDHDETQVKRQPPYNVILLNDDDHSFEYVIGMIQTLFGYERTMCERMAMKVHLENRVIVKTTTKEHAEFKRDQIHAFGPDKNIPRCAGSMSAEIEPAE